MQLGMVGLGRMGGNMVLRLLRAGHDCVAYDRDAERTQEFRRRRKPSQPEGRFVWPTWFACSAKPRAVWVMLPAGAITEATIAELAGMLESGDVIIDGGNTYFKDDVRRAGELARKKLAYLDVGTSGGVWGLERGYCLMIGGDQWAYERLEPIFACAGALAAQSRRASQGARHCRAWLLVLWPSRLGALREDDSQRHRIRHDAIVRRGI